MMYIYKKKTHGGEFISKFNQYASGIKLFKYHYLLLKLIILFRIMF